MADEVLPERLLLQWVLSLPYALRFLHATDADALKLVLGAVYRTISGYLLETAGQTRATANTGAVTLIQRFGSALDRASAFAAEVALAALRWICQGRGYELTSLDVQMAYRLASEAGQALGQSERVALLIQTMLKPTTREVRWVREMLNLPASSEAGHSWQRP